MRLGAFNGLCAVLLLACSHMSIFRASAEPLIRQAAQIHFMHGMATLASATFMNIGAVGARLAPAFFLGGTLLFCGPVYLEAAGFEDMFGMIKWLGVAGFAIGWLILAWASKDIDLVR
jgi:uncharacterized membrane protein YgdD (TMEM256/DUF423 family)